MHLDESPVPAESITNELASYPNDLLSSPLDVRQVTIKVLPGRGTSTVADSIDTVSKAGPFTRLSTGPPGRSTTWSAGII